MHTTLTILTHGEGFVSITDQVRDALANMDASSGVLHLFCMHTSCALVISEDYDPSARSDMEAFLQHLAPRNLGFIKHTLEGPDDSPSHMKSIVLHQNLACLVERGQLVLGQWQGIFLAEFRDAPHTRRITLKLLHD